ncbi:MAG: family 43 glycosylhydrolase [Luteolibacter sp.]
MKSRLFHCFSILFVSTSCAHAAVQENSSTAIHSGVAWYDQNAKMVSAHGGGIFKEGDKYYLFGEFKRDGGNEFSGFSCYSSSDLTNWTFESIALPVQEDGRLGPNRVGERPKVLKCPKTGEFVMYMHTDNSDYKDPAVGYATSKSVTGPYTFQGPILFGEKPIKKWDMSAYRDEDGTGYIVTHSGNLYRLSDDYKSVTAQVVKGMTQGCESPAIFKHKGLYYWLGSGLTGWERNDNYYFTAKSLEGPWEKRGNFAPKDTLTWNSQTTFVLPVEGSETTTFLYMGDRWAHPFQNSAATYVWQPLQFDDKGNISLPEFHPSWQIDVKTGKWSTSSPKGEIKDIGEFPNVQRKGEWKSHTDSNGFSDLRSNKKGDSLTIPFTGTQIGFHGVARPDGGFGRVEIKDANGNVVLTTIVETYCQYHEASLKFLSPTLKQGDYTLTLTVLGERFFWKAKKGTYGSSDDYVSIRKVLISK